MGGHEARILTADEIRQLPRTSIVWIDYWDGEEKKARHHDGRHEVLRRDAGRRGREYLHKRRGRYETGQVRRQLLAVLVCEADTETAGGNGVAA